LNNYQSANQQKTTRLKHGLLLFSCILLVVVGCERDDIRAYRVQREFNAEATQEHSHQTNTQEQKEPSAVQWVVPESWEQLNKVVSMRFATFNTPQNVEVTLAVFPGDVGGLLANVNRWRGQVGLNSIQEEELGEHAQQIEGTNSFVVDAVGSDVRLIGTVINIGDGKTWFAKVVGQPDIVEQVKEDIVSFSASFHIEQKQKTQAQEEESSIWIQPAEWTVDENASPILMAAYDSESGARVTLTALGGGGGGLLENINRWRNQLGLAPVDSMDSVDVTDLGNGAIVVDLLSEDGKSRIVSGVVPLGSETLFFKLTGSKIETEPELNRFNAFVLGVGLKRQDEP